VARVGEARLAQGGNGELRPPTPLYIRPADARRPRRTPQQSPRVGEG
jgi:hypothetical protein